MNFFLTYYVLCSKIIKIQLNIQSINSKRRKIMKKSLIVLAIVGLIATSVGCTKEYTPQERDTENKVSLEKETAEEIEKKEPIENVSYDLLESLFENKEKNIIIRYPKMTGFRGELLQDYMNQSLDNIINIFGESELYTDIDVMYEVTRMDDEILSVVFRGTGKFSEQRDIKILKSVNLDVAKSSNEINYANLINDNAAIRQILAEKVVELNLSSSFEAEGISIYFTDKDVVFYYMPLDDSAIDFIEVPVAIEEIQNFLNTDFGERPSS